MRTTTYSAHTEIHYAFPLIHIWCINSNLSENMKNGVFKAFKRASFSHFFLFKLFCSTSFRCDSSSSQWMKIVSIRFLLKCAILPFSLPFLFDVVALGRTSDINRDQKHVYFQPAANQIWCLLTPMEEGREQARDRTTLQQSFRTQYSQVTSSKSHFRYALILQTLFN